MAKWLNKLRGGSGEDDPEKNSEEAAGRPKRSGGIRAKIAAKVTEWQEATGLLQQLAEDGLKHLHMQDESIDKAKILDFAELNFRKNRIEIKVPGRDEAKELQRLFKEANELDPPLPLKRKEASNVRDGKLPYRLLIDINEVPAEKAVEMLEKTLKHIGVRPDWKGHYQETDHEAEAEFRKQVAEEDKDEGRGRRF